MFATNSKILIQGITEPLAIKSVKRMMDYGTNIVAGVSIGKGGENLADIPIFDLVETAIETIGEVEASIIFLPAYAVLDAGLEAMAAGIKKIIIVSAGIPPLDMVELLKIAQINQTLILGPGSGGLIVPDTICLGTIESEFYTSGNVGIISQSNTLSYEVALQLNKINLGQSFSISIGTDNIIGSNFDRWCSFLEEDSKTKVILLLGIIKNNWQETTIKYFKNNFNKPVIVYLAGIQAPLETNFQDAATIIAHKLSYFVPSNNNNKTIISSWQKTNITLAKRLSQIPELVQKAISN